MGRRCKTRTWQASAARQSAGMQDSLVQGIEALMPYSTTASVVSDDVEYEGPFQESIRGRSSYIGAMEAWSRNLPARLERFNITSIQTWALQPGEVAVRWSCSFVAPLPPTARLRGLPAGLEVLPDERVAVDLIVRTT